MPKGEYEVLSLPFECLRSIPGGINEVRLWHDDLLGCERVGKRMDISGIEQDGILPEPKTLQSIRHRNIVPIVAAAIVGDYPKPMRVIELITPYFARGSITDALLRGEGFPASEAVAVTQAALRGLSEMHELHRILHRDIKSGNILLDKASVAMVADLGLAGSLAQDGTAPTVNNPTIYSPPEFVTRGILDCGTDVYAMGLVLRELLGGNFPYEEYSTAHVLGVLQQGKQPLTARDLTLPIWTARGIRRIYAKTIHRDPAQRYRTARAMDEALSRVPVADWTQVSENRWETACRTAKSTTVAVEATTFKRKPGYRVSVTYSRGYGWRRTREDVDIDHLESAAMRNVFDQATQVALAR